MTLAFALLVTPITIRSVQAQTFTVLHRFTGARSGDGTLPEAGLVRDAAGNLYGTTQYGGTGCPIFVAPLQLVVFGCGVVFRVAANGAETLLHRFGAAFPTTKDGKYPVASLLRDSAGNIYGTTRLGGTFGWGAVFKLYPSGLEIVLHSFTNGADGGQPFGNVIRDVDGNLYGTTAAGGAFKNGMVFKLNTTDKETVLHSFTGGADGREPFGGLVRDPAGNLYGTTAGGGAFGNGTVFKLDTTGKEIVLHSFTSGADGSSPDAGLIRDSAGNLYGATTSGGAFGNGTVFKLNTTGEETVLHSFTGGADGGQPFAGLVRDAAGNLYGTTAGGGAFIPVP